jgi:hypothetical protein
MKLIILILTLSGCAAPVVYHKINQTPQEIAAAECDFMSQSAFDPYFPRNVFLKAKAELNAFNSCMKSKGYSPSN